MPTIMTTSAETGNALPKWIKDTLLNKLVAGPNGYLPQEIVEMHPNATLIRRNGEVNAWDNPEFRAAVEATEKKQVILAGIVTEVCTSSCGHFRCSFERSTHKSVGTAFLALSLREAGYSVWANTDASGTFTPRLADEANRRMEQAGVHLVGRTFEESVQLLRHLQMGMFGIVGDLMRDWRNTPGAAEVFPYLDTVSGWQEISEIPLQMLILEST